jgi:hypothetical protein
MGHATADNMAGRFEMFRIGQIRLTGRSSAGLIRALAPWCGQMQGFIHRKNIAHYRELLADDRLDEAGRAYVEKLLAEEEAKDRLRPRSQDDD